MPKLPISVVITHHNRPQFLEEALASVHHQTLQPNEIIIVDDHSTAEARRQVVRLRPFARIQLNSTNLGVSLSRNIGVEMARNNWIAFLDDDDLYHPRKLELQASYLNRHSECEVLGGPLWRVGPDGTGQIWGYREQRRLQLRDGLLYTASSMCSLLIHKSAYRHAGGMDARFRHMADLEFGIRLLASGCHMEILPEPLVTYRHGGRDELSLKWSRTVEAHFRIIHKHRRLYRQEFDTFGAMQEYARRAKFYGLRRGGPLGRSMWGAGCLAQWMVGKAPEVAEAEAASKASLAPAPMVTIARSGEQNNLIALQKEAQPCFGSGSPNSASR